MKILTDRSGGTTGYPLIRGNKTRGVPCNVEKMHMALEKVAHNHISPLCFSRPYAFGLMSWHWSGRISDEVFKSLFRYDPTPAETKVRTRFCDKYYEFASIQSQGQDSTPAIRMIADQDPTRQPGPHAKRPVRRVASRNDRRTHVCLVRSDLRENPNQTSSQESKRHKEIQRED